MKKLFFSLLAIILVSLTSLMIILSTLGLETNKFNKLISEKAAKANNINLKLEKIRFKLDPNKLSLFVETQNPIINYRDITIPVKNIKVYIDFLSLLKSSPKIKKIILVLHELNVSQINKLSSLIKPSNFRSFLNNKVNSGKIFTEIEIYLDKDGLFENFITKGNVENLNTQLFGGFSLSKTNLTFFADKNDILIKNIYGDIEGAKISDGDIKVELDNGIRLNSNFKSNINLNKKFFEKEIKLLKKFDLIKNIINLEGKFNNTFNIELDSTYKLINYNYNLSGELKKSKINLAKIAKNNFMKKEFNEIYLSNIQVNTFFSPKNISLSGEGNYSFNNYDFLKINLKKKIVNESLSLKANFDFKNDFYIDLINYKKSKNAVAELFIDMNKNNNNLRINEINFTEKNNVIKLSDLKFNKNKLLSFKKISVKTQNNDFLIKNDKKIIINGSKFDATNLAKFFNNQSKENKFENINRDIEIDFKKIDLPMSEELFNFKLIGEIKKGKFIKISSKGEFEGKNFLDISMKKDKNSEKKYLEIYSDLTQPLLSEYKFFKGLSGGKLLYTSVIDGLKYTSKLKIENFKVINAPGVVKLLSLADLGGLADLAEGEGLSFDLLEIDMEKSNDFLKLNEILALGPSLSVLMEGYQDKSGLTSLRGTIVPAKTLNKIISKIPVIGNIIIPKEVGEGLFGISFKMKGPKENIKTSINPIRTLTPRFIQKIVDKRKKTK